MSQSLRKHIVIGLVVNHSNHLCVAERLPGKHLEGLWECPGGKVEPNEDALQALKRELYEELGIEVETARPYQQFPYDYPEENHYVLLDFWWVDKFKGDVFGKEGQQVKWVSAEQLQHHPFPEANQSVLHQLINDGLIA